jgi:hypothetical protein
MLYSPAVENECIISGQSFWTDHLNGFRLKYNTARMNTSPYRPLNVDHSKASLAFWNSYSEYIQQGLNCSTKAAVRPRATRRKVLCKWLLTTESYRHFEVAPGLSLLGVGSDVVPSGGRTSAIWLPKL